MNQHWLKTITDSQIITAHEIAVQLSLNSHCKLQMAEEQLL
jgi:hypothetical protein